jgi:hypothetical protein
MQNYSNYEIIKFYNSKIHGILNFFRFASNRHSLLHYVIRLIKTSCALTLSRKMKLRSVKAGFNLANSAFSDFKRAAIKNSFKRTDRRDFGRPLNKLGGLRVEECTSKKFYSTSCPSEACEARFVLGSFSGASATHKTPSISPEKYYENSHKETTQILKENKGKSGVYR